MAIVDKLNTFCSSATTTGTAVETALGDVIDWTATYGPGGGNQAFFLMVHFHTAGATTATWWEVALYSDADGTVPTAGNLVGKWRFLNAEQVAGTTYYFPVGSAVAARWLRYLGLAEVSDDTYGTKPVVTCALCVNPNTALQ